MRNTTKPRIELRKVQHSKSLSEETPAYTAQVWVDGSHFCDVANHGQGGPDEQHGPKGESNRDFCPRLEALEKRIAETFPRVTYNGEDLGPSTLEYVCQGLLDEVEVDKAVQRSLKTKLMWLRDGKVFQISLTGKNKRFTRQQLVDHVRKKEPDARFLHDMPLTEARKYLVA